MSELRADLQVLANLVPQGAKVLDVGCGDGELLAWLVAHKQADARGLEMQQQRVKNCISKGLSVIQGNAEIDLEFYLAQSYDVVILSRTLQAMHDPVEILNQIIRIGIQVIVSIPNFGYFKNRIHLGMKGRMPVTSTLAYAWHNTPNIHFCTIRDFIELCQKQGISVEDHVYVGKEGKKSLFQGGLMLPNLLSEQGIFLLRGKN